MIELGPLPATQSSERIEAGVGERGGGRCPEIRGLDLYSPRRIFAARTALRIDMAIAALLRIVANPASENSSYRFQLPSAALAHRNARNV